MARAEPLSVSLDFIDRFRLFRKKGLSFAGGKMWKLTPYLMRLTGRFTFKLSRLAFCLFCFLLLAIDSSAQSVTNVDFVVVGSAYKLTGDAPYVYDTIPTGCILFWSIKPENAERAEIYRSESGHIAFVSNGRLVIAGSDGKPMVWFLNSGLQVMARVQQPPNGEYATVYKSTPNILYKNAYDTISLTLMRGIGSAAFLGASSDGPGGIIGRFGDYMVGAVGGNYCIPYLDKPRYSVSQQGFVPAWHQLWSFIEDNWYKSEQFRLRWAWRASSLTISIDAFKSHLSSKWWLTGKFIADSSGITSIDVMGGNGIGDIVGDGGGDGVSGTVPPDVSDYDGSVPGTIDNPPTNPLGQNGRYVYDPEKKIWQWQGDIADNATDIDPFGEDQPLPTYNTGDLAQESTLRKVLQTLEGFQKEQGIQPDVLQAMIDNGVVSIVDGMVQYWEGKNLGAKLDSIDSSVDDSANLVYGAANSINSKVSVIKDNSDTTAQKAGQIATALSPFGNVGNTINQINANIVTSGDNIVSAIEGSKVDLPTTDGQDTQDYDISKPDLSSQIDGWLSFNLPVINIPPVGTLQDYDIGFMDWKIPFSEFSKSKGSWYILALFRVREILAWLVYLSATLGVVKAMGAGV